MSAIFEEFEKQNIFIYSEYLPGDSHLSSRKMLKPPNYCKKNLQLLVGREAIGNHITTTRGESIIWSI